MSNDVTKNTIVGDNIIVNNIIDTRKEKEVDDLVKLAEEVSINIDYMYNQRRWLILSASLILALTLFAIYAVWNYFTLANWQPEVLSLVKSFIAIAIVTSASIAIRRFYVAYKMKNTIEIDAHILGRLLNMTDSLSRDLSDDSVIKKAYFDMRMSRINFKYAKFRKSSEKYQRTKTDTKREAVAPVSKPA